MKKHMKQILLLIVLLFYTLVYSQTVKIDSVPFIVKHGDLTFYLDKDTASFISVHNITIDEIKRLTGVRSDKWHKESPFGPYKKEFYLKTGYDLGHLTPSDITSYSDTVNYDSFSFFNQAPQLAGFNRGKWAQIEKKVENDIIKSGFDATIITGVIYDNNKKTYLNGSRIKIPMAFYKIVVTKISTTCYMGSNINGEMINTDLKTILQVARKNKNILNIIIIK